MGKCGYHVICRSLRAEALLSSQNVLTIIRLCMFCATDGTCSHSLFMFQHFILLLLLSFPVSHNGCTDTWMDGSIRPYCCFPPLHMPNNSVLPPEHFAYKTRPAGRSLSLANPCFRVPRAHFQSFSGGALDPMAKLQILGLVAILLAMVVWAEFQEKAAAATRFTAIDKYTTQGRQGNYGQGSLHPSQCPGQCSRRCSQTQHHKPCMFFCQKCCMTCLCVPPGFYGNKQVCPCYNNWKTKEGGPKCP